MLWGIAYFIGFFGLIYWESFIGIYDIDFDGYSNPPIFIVALVWPISLLLIACYSLLILYQYGIKQRVERSNFKKAKQREKERLRIAAEKETASYMAELEKEFPGLSEEVSQNYKTNNKV